jgi:hypothetical protein
MFAAAAMAMSSTFVLVNGLRLRGFVPSGRQNIHERSVDESGREYAAA